MPAFLYLLIPFVLRGCAVVGADWSSLVAMCSRVEMITVRSVKELGGFEKIGRRAIGFEAD